VATASSTLQRNAGRATSFDPGVARAFGEVVRELRVARGIAQDALALMASVDRSYFGKLERGERQPSLALLLRIATALGISGAELVTKAEARLQRPPRRRASS
jgi:XRE family transcriptional regulator, regulator of sulfur utilization